MYIYIHTYRYTFIHIYKELAILPGSAIVLRLYLTVNIRFLLNSSLLYSSQILNAKGKAIS
jgi:hypothetical protein